MNSALALKSDKTYVGQIKADHENNIGLLDTGKLSNPTGVPLVMQNQGFEDGQRRSLISHQCFLRQRNK